MASEPHSESRASARGRTLRVWLSAMAALSAASLVCAEPPHRIHFFDQPVTLALDTTRLALRATPGATAEDVRGTLRTLGVSARRAAPHAVAGWWVVEVAEEVASAGEIAGRVESLAASLLAHPDAAADFVSPVFVGSDGGPLFFTPTLLVRFAGTLAEEDASRALADAGAGGDADRDWAGMRGAYRVRTSSRSGLEVLAMANRLAVRPDVTYAEPDAVFTGRAERFPNDPGFPLAWGIHNVGQDGGTPDADMDGPEAWDVTAGDSAITVVVIDTGVEQDHPDLHQIPGTDLTSDPSDSGGPVNVFDNHGTAVAGCVSAAIDNGLGTVGIAPGAVVASARTFIAINFAGNWTSQASWTVDALVFAERIGARVTNNSNSYGFASSAIASKYAETRAADIVHFASAGNNANTTIVYPARLPSVSAVAALNRSGGLAGFSSRGPGLALSAPGASIYSTDRTGGAGYVNGDYAFVSGTSFSSPYAAGVAALVLSLNPTLSAPLVEGMLLRSSVDLGVPGYDETFGTGFVNADRALRQAQRPALRLQINGEHPGSDLVTTPADVRITLDMDPGPGAPAPVDWYLAVRVGAAVAWFTPAGLSPAPAPLLTQRPPLALRDALVLSGSLPPARFDFVMFLLEAGELVAFDVVAALVVGTGS